MASGISATKFKHFIKRNPSNIPNIPEFIAPRISLVPAPLATITFDTIFLVDKVL